MSKNTAYRWSHGGNLPGPAVQVATGTLLMQEAGPAPSGARGGVALYARVSSWDQRADMDRQLGRLTA